MLVLHLGPYKTGTTSLQHALSESAEQLKPHGISYDPVISPKMDVLVKGDDCWKAHHQLAFPFLGSPRAVVTCDDVRDWFGQIGDRPGNTLVSSEALWSMKPTDLRDLLMLTEAEVRVVAVFRCVVDSAASAWHTAVAEGYLGDYETYVSERVLGDAHKDFDYAYHLRPLIDRCDVRVVDYAATDQPLLSRVIAALDLPGEVFPNSSVHVRRHVRPNTWLTALTLSVQRYPGFTDLSYVERSRITNALRGVKDFIVPNNLLNARAVEYSTLSPERLRQLRALCLSNRRAVADLAYGPLTDCYCGITASACEAA